MSPTSPKNERRGHLPFLAIGVLVWVAALLFSVVTTFSVDPEVVPAAPPEVNTVEESVDGVWPDGLKNNLDPIDKPDQGVSM